MLIFTFLHEGSPNVVKEALANDVKVISVPVGDTVERLKSLPGCDVSTKYDYKELSYLIKKNINYVVKSLNQDEDVLHL